MFKIYKIGKIVENEIDIYKDTCTVCGCEYEFKLEDVTMLERKPNGNARWKCPCCGEVIEKPLSSLPYRTEQVDPKQAVKKFTCASYDNNGHCNTCNMQPKLVTLCGGDTSKCSISSSIISRTYKTR